MSTSILKYPATFNGVTLDGDEVVITNLTTLNAMRCLLKNISNLGTAIELDLSSLISGEYSIIFDNVSLTGLDRTSFKVSNQYDIPTFDEYVSVLSVDFISATDSDIVYHSWNTLDYMVQLISMDSVTLYEKIDTTGVGIITSINNVNITGVYTQGYSSYKAILFVKH